MSNIYIQEPPTNGKVLLSTTVGDIDIELWSKECPKACRNFVQLCMEGYYENTIFHRVIPEFIIQGGDPTGTGTGGESIYGKPFRDEFHTRLRFVRRGLVAMANAGANDNASQFFFTLGATPELNNKHTIFGKVAGDTIYNMLKLVEVEVGPDDRPLFPHKINKAKILSNPFDDIVPRRLPNRKKSEDEESSKKKKSQSKATKNFSLLSFGEEAEQEEDVVKKVNKSMKSKSKSSHDLLDDSKLSAVPAVETKDLTRLKRKQEREQEGDEHKKEDMTDSSEEEDNKEATKERIRKKLKREKHDDVQKTVVQKESIEEEPDDVALAKSKTLEELKKEARRLKRELRAAKAKEDNEKLEPKIEPEPTPTIETESALDALQGFKADRQKYKEKQKAQPKKGASREAQTMALLAKFQSKLSTAKQMAQDYGDEEEEEEERPPTPVQLTEDGEEIHEEVDDGSDLSWMSHKLKFEANKRKVIDANINDEDRYEIFDPRNPLNKRRREASKQAMKGKR